MERKYMQVDLQTLNDAVRDAAALRRIQRLQPAGGPGDTIFPPTYPPPPDRPRGSPPRHVFELRRVGGESVWCVLLDSVQSQANRLEEVLLAAADDSGDGRVPLPYVTVDFSHTGLEPLKRITSLSAPHRVYDAIMRDSLFDGVPFMQSEQGRRLAAATAGDATALLELSPTALVFGAWHSQGEGGGLGAKFARTIVSEIMGINAPVERIVVNQRTGEIESQTLGRRTGSRIDPLGVLRKVEVFKGASGWSLDKTEAGRGAKSVRPSEVNHSNVAPTVVPLGVTCDYAEHRAVITLAGLRRLRFGDEAQSAVGRTLVASLGLLALAEQDVRGYALRSRCDLVCDGRAPLELVHADGSTETFGLTREAARALYCDAYAQAEAAGFAFQSLALEPQDKLVQIVRRSRQLALEGEGEEGEGADGSRS